MRAEPTAFAVLGLKPGAEPAAIDEAYRRLIKQYHPDRSGGDSERAAEINRAYFELRRQRSPDAPPPPRGDIAEAIVARRAARQRTVHSHKGPRRVWPFLLLGLGGILFLQRERLSELAADLNAEMRPWRPELNSAPGAPPAQRIVNLDDPLQDEAIQASLGDLAGLGAKPPELLLADRSRDCHRQLRSEPSLAQLDRCAAFDYAVSTRAGRDIVADQGPFSASAVTARNMAGANLLSNDFLAIESRLDRVRSRVESALAPPPPSFSLPASGGPQPPSGA
jgi:hypothetical protein